MGVLLDLQLAADQYLFFDLLAVHRNGAGLVAFVGVGVQFDLGLFAGELRLAIAGVGVGVALGLLQAAGGQRALFDGIALGGMGVAGVALDRLGFLLAADEHRLTVAGLGVGVAGVALDRRDGFHRRALLLAANQFAVFVIAALAVGVAGVAFHRRNGFHRRALFLAADEGGLVAGVGVGVALHGLYRLALLLAADKLLVGLGVAVGRMGVGSNFLKAADQRAGVAAVRLAVGVGLQLLDGADQFTLLVIAQVVMGMYHKVRQAANRLGVGVALRVAALGVLVHRGTLQHPAGMLLRLAVQHKGRYGTGGNQQCKAEEHREFAVAALFVLQQLCGLLHGRFHGIVSFLEYLISNSGVILCQTGEGLLRARPASSRGRSPFPC